MTDPEAFLEERLAWRRQHQALRTLTPRDPALVDFCSNDYLSIATGDLLGPTLRHRTGVDEGREYWGTGATGSRLLSGNSLEVEQLEHSLAEFHGASAGLIFNSGYDANLGLLQAVPSEHHSVIYDELVHASMRDGMRLGSARSYPFRHNDVSHLATRLSQVGGPAVVVVESIYSMDGDLAPLAEIATLSERHGALLVVDEAHATGVFGPAGRGRVSELGLEARVFARVHTFGKALGAHGAIVIGSQRLRETLVNFARSVIYTTALPPASVRAIAAAFALCSGEPGDRSRRQLQGLIEGFRRRVAALGGSAFLDAPGPIQGLLVDNNLAARTLSARLREHGLDARPILSPTVQRGRERLRISLHAHNTVAEIERLFELLADRP